MKFYILLPFFFFQLGDACPPGSGQSPPITVNVNQLPMDWSTPGGATASGNLITIQNDLRSAVQNAARRAFPFGAQNSYSRNMGLVTLQNPQSFVCTNPTPSTGGVTQVSAPCSTSAGNNQLIQNTCVGTPPVCYSSWRIQFTLRDISAPTMQQQISQFETLLEQEIQNLKGVSQVQVDAGDLSGWMGGIFPYG